LNGKQNKIVNSSVITLNQLNAFAVVTSELETDFITVNSSLSAITITSNTSISGQTISSSGNLFYNTNNNVSTKINDLQSNINLKQNLIQDGGLSIAKTDGLLTALDSSAKLASANTFTGLQTINGDLKADHVLVKITAPTLNTHLTSNLYVDTALIGKQNTLTASSDVTMNTLTASSAIVNSVDIGSGFSSLQTQVDALIEYITKVGFRAYTLSVATINAGNNLPYNLVDSDSENAYSNNIYTIAHDGTYLFTLGVYTISDTTFVVNLIRKRAGVETIIQQLTNGTSLANETSYSLTTIDQCFVGDEIYAYLVTGSVRLNPFNATAPNQFNSFSGVRLSN
jgi:hypothetical protein